VERNRYHAGFGNWCRDCDGLCKVPGPVDDDPPGHGWEPVFKSNRAENWVIGVLFALCGLIGFGIYKLAGVFGG